jgi:hypothetical protein
LANRSKMTEISSMALPRSASLFVVCTATASPHRAAD